MNSTVLIVDDNEKLSRSLARNFSLKKIPTVSVSTSREGLSRLKTDQYRVILLDIMLGEDSGLEMLGTMRDRGDSTPVIIMTGHATIENTIEALKQGANDYVQKPIQFDQLFDICEPYIKSGETPSPLNKKFVPITRDPAFLEILKHAQKIAPTEIPILITGESGTGKEVVADYIHAHSRRSSREMYRLNSASLPESLLENELFGHEKGAYTGATSLTHGIFERSHQTTLFLDELGDMSLSIQAKILRAIENQEVRRIGGDKLLKVDVRFIAATNKDLTELIETHYFREDLFYRLNTGHIHIPPLRERSGDIPLLINNFLVFFAAKLNKQIINVSDPLMEIFLKYPWPGNVRELKNIIHYCFTIASSEEILVENLPSSFDRQRKTIPGRKIKNSSGPLEEVERKLIDRILKETKYNKTLVAQNLGISRTTLYKKMRKYGLE